MRLFAQLQQGLQHGLQQLQQSVVIGGKKPPRANGSTQHSELDSNTPPDVRAGEGGENKEDAAAADAARRRAEDAEAAARSCQKSSIVAERLCIVCILGH